MRLNVLLNRTWRHLPTLAASALLVACQLPGAGKDAPEEAMPVKVVEMVPPAADCPPPVIPEPPKCAPPAPPKVVYRSGPESKMANVVSVDDKLVVGRVENVALHTGVVVKAKIDTGATISSLNAQDVKLFERDGDDWVRFAIDNPKKKSEKLYFEYKVKRYKSIKQIGTEPQRRPVITMTLNLGRITEKVDVTLADRSGYLYQLLVGRNFLRDRTMVDVSRKFITVPQTKPPEPVIKQ